uniref:EF-hand domain-containing protein n=1 Tax=Steinernema glaseri TaxID=37863 RepID=A0A1I8AQB4_9BILA
AIGRRRLVRLKDNDGNLCSTKTELQRIAKDFYEALYASTVDIEYREPESQEDCPPFLIAEVEEALKKMKNGTAPGIDKITVEMLKAGKNFLLPDLTKLFNACLQQGSIPEKMADASTLLL